MKTHKLEFYRNFFSGQWRWRIKGSNGKKICASSESFKNKGDCVHNAQITGESITKYFENVK